MYAFWVGYTDSGLLQSSYSFYVLLVHIIITVIQIPNNSSPSYTALVLGWVGVGFIFFLIALVAFMKLHFLEYLSHELKKYKVYGFSEFNLVYTKAKKLNELTNDELDKIISVI
jgi:fumarate reductase subunit D